MTQTEAWELLRSTSLDDRLRAARFLEKKATSDEITLLQEARQRETVAWIRDALDRAIARTMYGVSRYPSVSTAPEEVSAGEQDVLVRATQEVTSAIVHELEPLLGLLKLTAAEEVPNYASSKTKERVERLESLAVAVSNLRRASQTPNLQQFNLGEAVKTTVADTKAEHVVLAGPAQVEVLGDRGLVCLALSNAIRNAVEATPPSDRDNSPIVVNWGRTDRDAWISVIDQGVGLQEQPAVLMKIGNSTKEDHLGMGLAIAKTAISSLGGEVTLESAGIKGAKFETRWPQGGTNATPLPGG